MADRPQGAAAADEQRGARESTASDAGYDADDQVRCGEAHGSMIKGGIHILT